MKKDFYFVHLLNDFSGSPRVLADMLSGLSGVDNKTLITSQHDGFLQKSKTTKRIVVPYYNSRHKLVTLALYTLSQLIIFILLSILLMKGRLMGRGQVVISNTLLPFGANLASKLFANRLICYVHETSVSPRPLQQMLTGIVKYCADEVIFVSNYVRDFHQGWAKNKLSHVVYNCVSKEFVHAKQPSNASLETKFSSQSVLFVGSLKLYKGIDTFVELAKALPQYQFTAVVNANYADYQSFLQENQNVSNLSVVHRPDNLSQIYQQHSLLVNLSKPSQCTETFGLTLIEAMACATPVIAPNVGGPLEVVNNNCGFTLNVTNLNELSSHVQHLLNSQNIWLDTAHNAYKQSQYFSQATYKKKVSALVLADKGNK
ncbi:glycosyltransferase family 4 protein [Vibrio cyclitrophicus]|uniref:glycosyltransferase family 4 protein n=1 Tax=Vibrio cyclitrophicus TaxID=47951 RepID=UPI000C8304CB|nr:glycosyltransferase [Vibrio cyclitrophicus]PMJ52662.1 hypothetical protein BCU19_21005 [Vibrio cyclitrophicus]